MSFDLIPAMKISSSALTAERARMKIAANNLANINSTSTTEGQEPYKKREVVFKSVLQDILGQSDPTAGLDGVRVESVTSSNKPAIQVYAPYHPSANKEGMIKLPNIKPIEEMVNMISATRAYEANLAVIKNSRSIAEETLKLGD